MKTWRLVVGLSVLVSVGWSAPGVAQDEAIDLVLGLLAESDKDLRALAHDQIRKEVPGTAATKKFADALPKLAPDAQVGLLSALADRGDATAAPAVREVLAATQEAAVRVAALKALGPLGASQDLALLVKSTAAESAAERDAARASLVRLPGEAVAGMIAELGSAASPATRVTLLGLLTERRARAAVPAAIEAALDRDPGVRRAALAACSELAAPEQVAGLIQVVLKSEGRDREAAEKTVAAVCHRIADNEARAAPVLAAMKELSEAERRTILATLGRVGGPAALAVVDEAVASSNAELHDAGVRALCNWPDGSVTSRLLQRARTELHANHQKQTLAALIRTAPLPDGRTDRRRLDTLRTAFVMCPSDAEKNQVLDRAKAVRSIDTLRFVVPFLDQPPFAQQACLTIVELAHHSSLRESHKDEFHGVLDRVQKISKDATVIDRAERYKTGQTWVRPKDE